MIDLLECEVGGLRVEVVDHRNEAEVEHAKVNVRAVADGLDGDRGDLDDKEGELIFSSSHTEDTHDPVRSGGECRGRGSDGQRGVLGRE